MNQKEPGEVQIFHRFTAEDLAAYKSLMIDNHLEFMTTCKCRAQSVLITVKFKVPMQVSDFDEALTSINPGLRRMSSS